jgi:hypothetical protein
MEFEIVLNEIEQRLDVEQKESLLRDLISYADRGWLEMSLRDFDVIGRTKIYKDFGWHNMAHQMRGAEQRKDAHLTSLLGNVSIGGWISRYLLQYPLKQFLPLLHRYMSVAGLNLTVGITNN